jgi:hypothetical protein
MGAETSRERVMRMRFELERDDNPPLFDELMKFPKGTKRLNRLRTLAHEGLHTQRGSSVPLGRAEAKREEVIGEGQRGQAHSVLAAASNELFGPAIDAGASLDA